MNQRIPSTEPIIRIRNFQIDGIIGILPHERVTPQPIVVNAELHCSRILGSQTDQIADTVDYATICEQFSTIISTTQFQLLEKLVAALLQAALADDRVISARVSAAKPRAIEAAETVEVELFGHRKDVIT